ncbi:MAG: O-antigen ligase family protein [Bacteroidota bacterium]|jgi:O-antigen ligase
MNDKLQMVKAGAWCLVISSLLMADAARALLSISMILLALVLLYDSIVGKNHLSLSSTRMLLFMALGFLLLYGVQFLYSENKSYLWERIGIKLPFILLPLVALRSSPVSSKYTRFILLYYVALMALVSLAMFVRYLLNKDAYDLLYAQSSVMPGPISHIRLSIMIAFAAYAAYYLLYIIRQHSFRILLIGCLVLLIMFTHVYSVRSGLFAFYTLVVYELMCRILNTTHKGKFLAICASIACIALAAAWFTPTIRNKISITVEELNQYAQGRNLNHNSIGKRLASYHIAIDIAKQNPLWGCGIGDYTDLNTSAFNQRHPEVEVPIIAHNQFLYYLAASGIFGVLLFLCFFFYPIVHIQRLPRLLAAQLLVLLVSFQTEPMLETQLGVAYSVVFWLLPVCMQFEESSS